MKSKEENKTDRDRVTETEKDKETEETERKKETYKDNQREQRQMASKGTEMRLTSPGRWEKGRQWK